MPTGVKGQLSASAQQEEEEGRAPRTLFADPFLGPQVPGMVLGIQLKKIEDRKNSGTGFPTAVQRTLWKKYCFIF